ncbi:hypothetical protein HBI25_025640 [Parastagonospora nodorum]|nr:hypothetical protein HBH51_003420 [Parastagonospora nodorum]KAH4004925.1 hypothetical protein HBI10_041930 [Parastagonospora nodorum]KAH4030824.1 hypothetical protein HBI13_025380 [Parastagonospora nodorum]KAH4071240.1 hypothetical protein HBH50_078290 [Parastagonospora nodorum]KAH4093935.1 hypothetical protein HBH48_066540 [Parastagonospora nodorum]
MGPSHFSNSSSSSHHPQDSPSSNALPIPSSQLRISRLFSIAGPSAMARARPSMETKQNASLPQKISLSKLYFLQGTLSHSITGPIYFVNNLNNSQWPPSTCPSSPAANTLSTS